MLDPFPLCCGQIEPGPRVMWGAHLGTWQEVPDPARGGRFSSACSGVCTHARILLQQFLIPGSPTRQSYSRAIHLVFSKESSSLCRTKHLFYLFLSSYFTVFFCCFVSDWHSPAPASSLPAAALLSSAGCCSAPWEDKWGLRGDGESGPSAHSAVTPPAG